MLPTLHKIGEQLLEGKGIWARLTSEPKYDPDKTNWVVPILFDCDAGEIKILESEKKRFDPEESAVKNRYVNTGLWGPRGKKCCVTAEQKNLKMLQESLIGKTDNDAGSMMVSYDSFYEGNNQGQPFRIALSEIGLLKKKLLDRKLDLQKKLDDSAKEEKEEDEELNKDFKAVKKQLDINLADIKKELNFSKDEEAVLFYAVIYSKEVNNGEPIPLFKLEGFEDFIIEKFGSSEGKEGLDYLFGNFSKVVVEASFSSRYNINKIFQTTTFNYATEFASKSFNKNFQVAPEVTSALDKASSFILNRWQVRIAGLPHIVIPSFLNKDLDELEIEELEEFILTSDELLFKSNEFETDIKRKLPEAELFWLNYLAFESDGNSFKVINHIQDVNSQHLKKVINAFADAGFLFKEHIGGKFLFNLQSIYWIIPVREGTKEKKNEVLVLFKEILEQRQIDEQTIFDQYIKMILCHWFKRYRQYQFKSSPISFDYAAKEASFKYSALIYALKKLNLLNMETSEETLTTNSENSSDIQVRINEFFERMEYTPQESAMFYLGRVLNAVAYAQYKKGHQSKPVLNKINFNGMDASAVERFAMGLEEKTRQYNIHGFTDFLFKPFYDQFKEEKWKLSPQKNIFYLMAGYTFGIGKSSKESNSETNKS